MLVATIFMLAVIAEDDAAVKVFVENCESRLPAVMESMKQNIKQPPAPKIPLSGQQLKAFYVEQKKHTEALKVKLKRLEAKDIQTYADLPSQEVLRAQLLGLLNTPATRLVRLLKTPATQLAQVLKAKAEKDSKAENA